MDLKPPHAWGFLLLFVVSATPNRALGPGVGQLVTTPASQGASWQVPAHRTSHSVGRGAYVIRALPELCVVIVSERLERLRFLSGFSFVGLLEAPARPGLCLLSDRGPSSFCDIIERFGHATMVRP